MEKQETQLKTCRACKVPQELVEFNKDSKSKDGHRSQCRSCQKIERAERTEREKTGRLVKRAERKERNEKPTPSISYTLPEAAEEEKLEEKVYCPACSKMKLRNEFYADKSRANKLSSRCKSCQKETKTIRPVTRVVPPMAPQRTTDNITSMANQAALKVLIQRHELEFRNLVRLERQRLGVTAKWRNLAETSY